VKAASFDPACNQRNEVPKHGSDMDLF
jgi:hypothetical protein